MYYVFDAVISGAVCFGLGVYLAGNVKEEIAAAHSKLDAILALVRRS